MSPKPCWKPLWALQGQRAQGNGAQNCAKQHQQLLLHPSVPACPCASSKRVSLDWPNRVLELSQQHCQWEGTSLLQQTQVVVQGLASSGPRRKNSTSENTTCSTQWFFVTSKLHFYGNETGISEKLKNSRNLWVLRIFVDFFLKGCFRIVACDELTTALIPVPLCQCREKVEKTRSEVEARKKGQMGGRCFKVLFLFLCILLWFDRWKI